MDPRYTKARELFNKALDLETDAERNAFFEEIAAHSPDLVARVRDLMRAHEEAGVGGFIAAEHRGKNGTVWQAVEVAEGSQIGRYRILEKIGEGGMGIVYMAEEEEPVRRKVALKIVKAGMDSKQVVARFEAERQALAMMDNPHIAKIFDAGVTETGRPFFVMELVRGISITKFCDDHQLAIKDRLELLIPVCHAIQHAHQKGVIHRDIKPSNILVTIDGSVSHPMVIDFGVAKATNQRLTEKTLFTKFAQLIGTPAYMSPEQAEMSRQDVDTRSDVYSLGVLLYELLTGTPPFSEERLRSAGYVEIQKIIADEVPPRPSTKLTMLSEKELTTTAKRCRSEAPKLLYFVKGDLDWITMKCLEKDRSRRYPSVTDLALDIERHLANEAINARPPSRAYRLRKAWQRNKIVYTACLGMALALLTGFIVSLWQTHNAIEARTLAQSESLRARQGNYVSDMNLAAQAWNAGDLLRARELLATHASRTGERDLRGFEWRLLWGLAHEDETQLSFNTAPHKVVAVAVSPRGRFLAWSGDDGSIRMVDLQTKESRTGYRSHGEDVTSLAFSHGDQALLATGSRGGMLEIWDVGNEKRKRILAGHTGRITHLAFQADDARLNSVAADKTIRIWELAKAEATTIESPGGQVIVSRDGETLATYGGINNGIRFWRAHPTPTERQPLPGQNGLMKAAALSSNGKSVVFSTFGSVLARWKVDSPTPMMNFWQSQITDRLALSADDRILASAGTDNLIKLWNVETGEEFAVLRGHTTSITHLALSADGGTLASVDAQKNVKVWGTHPSANHRVFPHHWLVLYLAASPDGKFLAVSDPNSDTLCLWNLSTRESLPLITNDKVNAAFSPDGKWLATAHLYSGTVELWERRGDGYRKHQSFEPTTATHGNHLHFSPDSGMLVFRGPDGVFSLVDIENLEIIGTLQGRRSFFCAAAFSQDGRLIATGSGRMIRIWKAATQELLSTIDDQESPLSLAFNSDATVLIAASGNEEIRRWDVSDPARPRILSALRGHIALVTQVALSPDGKALASTSLDGTFKLWDMATGQVLASLQGHRSAVNCLAWAPDGQTVYTGGGDGMVRLWKAPPWNETQAAEQELTR